MSTRGAAFALVDALYQTAASEYEHRRSEAEAVVVEYVWHDFAAYDVRPQWEIRATDPPGRRLRRPPRKRHDVFEYGLTATGAMALERYYDSGAVREEGFISRGDGVVERVDFRHGNDGSVALLRCEILVGDADTPARWVARSSSAYGLEEYVWGGLGLHAATHLWGETPGDLTVDNEYIFHYSPAGELLSVDETTWDEDGDTWTNAVWPPGEDRDESGDDGWTLVDASALHRAHPDSFWVPSGADKAAVAVGTRVQLVFEHARGGERMWVVVTEVDGASFVGTLDNMPVEISELAPGAVIHFTADHIIDIRH